MELKGKRLLFLGGPMQVVKAVEQANSMGVYTIVTDKNEKAYAKSIANEALPYSVTDVDAIVSWCQQHPVDGVLNFGVDPAQKPYVLICEALGLPHFGTLEQVEYLSNKQAFKDLCRKCGVDVIQSYTEDDITDDFHDYPLIIKPAQNCGSRGSSVCHNKQEADQGILKASEASTNGKVIIERYMEGYQDFSAEYYVIDGKAFLVRTNDRYVGKKEDKLNRQAVATVMPSKHTEMYMKNVNPRVVKMLEYIGVSDGALFMQGFVDGDTVRFYDPAYRFPGSWYEKLLFSATGVNLMEYAVSFALGVHKDAIPALDHAYQLNGKCAVTMLFTARPGRISVASGMDEVAQMPGVITAVFKETVGNVIPASGDVAQRVGEVDLLIEDDKKAIEDKVLLIQSKVKVLDEAGENMLVSLADPRSFR